MPGVVLLNLDAIRTGDQGGVCGEVMEIMAVLSAAGVRRELLHAAGKAGALAGGTAAGMAADAVDRLLDSAAISAGEADEELAKVLLSLRLVALRHLNELGDSAAQAIAVGEPLTADFDRVLGPYRRETLASRDNLAQAYQSAGRTAAVIALFEHTLGARERELGTDHPETLQSRENLAGAYLEASRTADAIPLFEQVLAARERVLGPDHPATVTARNNLAMARSRRFRRSARWPWSGRDRRRWG